MLTLKQRKGVVMYSNYSFLRDELALEEIRKHKWIESEKQQKEVGFATAAVDWI